jgi:5-methyltetrahydropteroyltriglutamate--homocysteine methyltransferase
MDLAIRADRAVLEGIPDHVRSGLHVCRGNHRSRWLFQGSLEPVAERMFSELPYDSFLVEWDDIERDGGYEPIRHVPEGHVLVLGLIDTKHAAMERADDIARRLEQAADYLPLEQLALSPQCGFASTWHGNEIDEATQWRKLELVVDVAQRVWA